MLEQRIDQLERQIKILKAVCLALIIGVGLTVTLGATVQSIPKPITTTEFTLVDKNGDRRAHLDVTPAGAANFKLYDEKGMFAQIDSTTTGGFIMLKGTRSNSGQMWLKFNDGAPNIWFAPSDKSKVPSVYATSGGSVKFLDDGTIKLGK